MKWQLWQGMGKLGTPAFTTWLSSVKFHTIKWNSIHAKLLATYLLLTTFGTSMMAGYILWSFYDYFMQTRQTDLENWTDALGESLADSLEEKKWNGLG